MSRKTRLSLLIVALVVLLTTVILLVPQRVVDGTVVMKRERPFQVVVQYSPDGYPEVATLDVDADTWDRLVEGELVQVAYVPVRALRLMQWYPGKRLVQSGPPRVQWPDVQKRGRAVVQAVRGTEVELRFVPEGRNEPVTAVDHVDTSTAANLAKDRIVDVEYSLARPREARMVSQKNLPGQN